MNGSDGNQPKPIFNTRILLGEGVEEELFFRALLKHLEIVDVEVGSYGGKTKLASYLKALRNRSGFVKVATLAILRDADEDPSGAESSVASAIAAAQFPTSLKVVKMVLPGNAEIGALENLCLKTLSGSAIENCVESYLRCATEATGVTHETTTNKAKARIHTWLAAQVAPDLRLGHAAERGYLNWNSPLFDNLREFLRSL